MVYRGCLARRDLAAWIQTLAKVCCKGNGGAKAALLLAPTESTHPPEVQVALHFASELDKRPGLVNLQPSFQDLILDAREEIKGIDPWQFKRAAMVHGGVS